MGRGDDGGWDEVARQREHAARVRSPAAIRAVQAEALRLAGRVRGRRVLEWARADHWLAPRLAERGADVVAASPVRARLEALSDVALKRGVALATVWLEPGGELPRGPFQLAVALHGPEFDRPSAGELAALGARLRRGGRLLLSVAHRAAPGEITDLFAALRAAGFRVVDVAEPATAPPALVVLAERPGRARRRA